MKETSVCSSSECVESTQLYGSTTAVLTCGVLHAHVIRDPPDEARQLAKQVQQLRQRLAH